ncbi:hypothetical protein INR49_000809 [Caranx melampygus]|nr:hypothetical protein INR49_000809 [Caranx melampygus]
MRADEDPAQPEERGAATSVLDFAQETEPGTLHLFLQQQLSSSSNYHVLQHNGEEDGGQKTLRELQGKEERTNRPQQGEKGRGGEEEERAPPTPQKSCCRPSSHKNFSACFKQHSTMLTGNNGVCRVLVLMAKKMVVKLPEGATAGRVRRGGAAAVWQWFGVGAWGRGGRLIHCNPPPLTPSSPRPPPPSPLFH